MTEHEIDELIEIIEYKMIGVGDTSLYSNSTRQEYRIRKLALAALQDHKNGMVSVPSEPTDEMLDGIVSACEENISAEESYDSFSGATEVGFVINGIGSGFSDLIKAAPQSEVSKIIGGNDD